MAEHLAIDGRVHAAIVRGILADGFAPNADELADALGATAGDIEASLGRLAENHGLVLHPGRPEVWIAHPFSLTPTNVWVAYTLCDYPKVRLNSTSETSVGPR
jgi:hypothetical protein